MGFYQDYKKELLSEIAGKDIQLLGQIRVSDEEYEKLVERGRDFVENATDLNNPKPDILMSLLMVQIAIFHYQEGNYWKYFEKELGIPVSAQKQNYLGKVFVKTIEFYKLLRLEKQSSQEQYVENIKAHAFVTNSYMAGFFEFASAFHENNLLRDLPSSPEDMLEIIEGLSDFMKDTMSSSSDSVKSGTTAAKSYKLLKSTRRVFAQCDPITVSNVFYPILKTIDNDLFDQKLPSGNLNRFDSSYIDWKKEQEKKKDAQSSRGERLNRGGYSKKPYLKIDPHTEQTLLIIPAQTFRKGDVEDDAGVSIIINGYSEFKRIELRDSFGILISEPIKIPVPNAFDEIEIKFINAGGKYYRLKNRDYRILNDKWQTVDKLSTGTNNIIIRKGTDVYWNENCEIIECTTEYVNWDFYSVKINKDSACKIGKQTLSIVGEYSKKPIFDNEIESFDVLDEDKNKIIATKLHPVISFEADEGLVPGTIISINSNHFPVRDIPEEKRPSFIDSGKAAVTIDINDLISHKEEGYYSIEIDIPTIGKRDICNYVLLRKIGCNLDYGRYLFNKEAKLKVSSPIHMVSGDPEWAVDEAELNEYIYTIPIKPDLEYVDLDLYLNGESDKILYIRKPINVFSYGFTADEKIYLREKSDYIWHTDLTDNLYVRLKNIDEVYAYYAGEEEELYKGELISPGVFRIDISEIRKKIEQNFDAKWHHIRLFLGKTDGKSLGLGDILLKNVIFPNPLMRIQSTDGLIHIPIEEIKGKAESLITIIDSETQEAVVNERLLHEGENEFPELDPSKAYDYVILSREDDEFGLFSETKEVRRLENHVTRDSSDLTGYSVKIESIEYDGEPLQLNLSYRIRVIQRLEKKVFLGLLDGSAFDETGKIDRSKTQYLKEIIIGVIEDKEVSKAAITGRYDGKERPLFYDAVKKTLVRGDSPAALEALDKKRYQKLLIEKMRIVFYKSKLRELPGPSNTGDNKIQTVPDDYSRGPAFKGIIKGIDVFSSNKAITAVRTHPYIAVEVDENAIADSVLIVNGTRYLIKDLSNITKHYITQSKRHIFSIDINGIYETPEDGYFKIDIYVPGQGTRNICEYALLNSFKCYLDRSNYIFQETARLSLIDPTHIVNNHEVWKKEEDPEYDSVYTIPLDPYMDYVELNLSLTNEDGESLIVRKPISVFSYGFSYDERIFLRNEDNVHWYKDITNTLFVRNKTANGVAACYAEPEKTLVHGEEIEPGVYKIDISKIRSKIVIENKAKVSHHIHLFFGSNYEKHLALNEILRSNKIEPDPFSSLEMRNGVVNIHVETLTGKAQSIIRVDDALTKKTVKSIPLRLGKNSIDGLAIDREYIFNLFSKEFNAANGVTYRCVRKKEGVIFADSGNLKGYSIWIDNFIYDGETLQLDYTYIIKVVEQYENETYLGFLTGYRRNNLNEIVWEYPEKIGKVIIRPFNDTDPIKARFIGQAGNGWDALYYDSKEGALLKADLPIKSTSTRFIKLTIEKSYFTFQTRKLRKLKE